MYLIDIIPLAKIPHTQPPILSYFFSRILPPGALVQIPLGRRQENGIVISARDIAESKMAIKNADFELRNISKIISAQPILTTQQIELALFLGQYYFCAPGIFAKMSLSPYYSSSKPRHSEARREVLDYAPATLRSNNKLKQVMILAPTISNVHSMAKSYPDAIIWHSDLTQKQKTAAWLTVKNNQASTIIGTRSAIFLPFSNLHEIIIIDADNPSHKSWDMFPHYDSRVAAQKLTEIFQSRLTTPPFIKGGGEGFNLSPPPPAIIDMRQELQNGNFSIFSYEIFEAVKKTLTEKKQAVLFINRRGAANFILCRDCGYIAKCPNCDAPMAYHLVNTKPTLFCHHCGAKDTAPKNCPKCHSWRIKTVGGGSQKVAAEAHNFFPDAKILRLDSDSAPKAKDQQKIIADFTKHKVDILIATPMIFSWLTELAAASPQIVGILSADTLLHIPDFRSGERTFQIITTLGSVIPAEAGIQNFHPPFIKEGRGGFILPFVKVVPRRGEGFKSPLIPLYKGENFFIQTYNPDNSVLKYVRDNDYEGFIKEDMETRQALNYPPFSQIVKLTFRLRDAKRAGQEAKILAARLNDILSSSSVIHTPHSVIPAQAGIQIFFPPLRKESRGGFNAPLPTLPCVERQGTLSHRDCRPKARQYRQRNGQCRRWDAEISPALPAFLARERGKFVWNIIIKFISSPYEGEDKGEVNFPLFRKEGLGEIYTSSDFLSYRNSLLQYIPQNWEIDVDPENLL